MPNRKNYIYGSLTRIAPLPEIGYVTRKLNKSEWDTGDFVIVNVIDPANGQIKVELRNGRATEVMKGDFIIGALGVRHATLEATGDWRVVGDDLQMEVLTGAGLFGKLTSKSVYVPQVVSCTYEGHLYLSGQKLTMDQFVQPQDQIVSLTCPVVLIVGTSMSAGKTTAARVIIRRLKRMGLKVAGAKLTGAGRYKDILAMKDAGADAIFDFVDVGLPSSIIEPSLYKNRIVKLLSLIQKTEPDVAVFEIGASPLEPYNGKTAIDLVWPNVKCMILCATDPYSVLGVMEGFKLQPTFVTGIATNTHAGCELIEKLCNVPAINIISGDKQEQIDRVLTKTLDIQLSPV